MSTMYKINSIFSDLKLFSKEQIFRFISGKAAEQTGKDSDEILDILLRAEDELPSGIGDGVAIPHLKLDNLGAPYSLFAKLSQSVDFDAVDGMPVDMIFLLISPESDGPLHLSRLARISRFFRNREACNRLRYADNDNTIRTLIHEPIEAANNAA